MQLNRQTLSMLFILLLPTASFSAVSAILLDKTPQQLRSEVPSEQAATTVSVVADHEAHAIDLDKKHKPGKQMLLIGGSKSFLVSLGEGEFVANLADIRSSKQVRKVRVDGYLIKPAATAAYVMFPMVTALDAEGNILETLEPLENSRAKGNAIQNYFLLPDGTSYLLIHGHPDIVAPSNPDPEESDGAAKALAAIGGVIGGLAYGAAQSSLVEKGKANLSGVGVVEVFAE